MKSINKYTSIILLNLFIFGCSDKLDVNPVSEITSAGFWNHPGDAESYLVGIYDRLRNITNTTLYGEDRSDTFAPGHIGPVTEAWAQSLNAANAPSWDSEYNFIYHINRLIKETAAIEFNNLADKDRIFAEAYALRAYMYFEMAKIWGDVPLVLEPTENPDADLKARSPVNEVFTQINADINQALGLFPESGYVDKNRISKPATYALLADVKLWTAKVLDGGDADLNAALNAIAEVEASGVSLLEDYRTIYQTDNKKNDEIIFSVFFDRDELTLNGNLDPVEISHYGRTLATRGDNVAQADNFLDLNYTDRNHARAVYQPSQKLRDLFAQNPNDEREPVAIIDAIFTDPSTSVVDTILTTFNKFRGTWYEDRYYEDDTPLYRYGGIVLLKAEALAALGRTTEAIAELDKTRERAGIGKYTGSTDQQSVEKEILDERWRELVVELKRWWDLVRFHHGGTINIYEEVPNLNAKPEYPLYFPVDQAVLDNNDLIKQTQGY